MRSSILAIGIATALSVVMTVPACVGDSPVTGPDTPGTDAGNDATATDAGGDTSAPTDGPDSGCGDTQSSQENCGACGHPCLAGYACGKGVCGNVVVQIAGSPLAADNCAVLAGGTVWCWGANVKGELGVGNRNAQSVATKIVLDGNGANFDHVVEVAVGFLHTCARKDDGSIWCWGWSAQGQTGIALGGAPVDDVLKPMRVGNFTGYKAIRAGGQTTCGIDQAGKVVCWGSNDHWLLGRASDPAADVVAGNGCDGTLSKPTYASATPSVVKEGPTPIIATNLAMSDQWACATDNSGNVKCWGAADYDQLGDNNGGPFPVATCASMPTTVNVALSPASVGVGRNGGCALYGQLEDAKCWGYNSEGELGDGDKLHTGPKAVGRFLAASGGFDHMCFLKATGGGVACAGDNDHRALGNGNGSLGVTTPQDVLIGSNPITDVVQLASGYFQTCALRTDGTVWCWGDNTVLGGGRLGDGTSMDRIGAVEVVGLPR